MVTAALITAEQFAEMEFGELEDFELVDGELVPIASGTPLHGMIRDNVVGILQGYLRLRA
jgi:hypothetical protein